MTCLFWLAVLVSLATPAWADTASVDGVEVSSRDLGHKREGTTCAYRLTNRSAEFVTQVAISREGHPVLEIPPIEHWFHTIGAAKAPDDELWTGTEPDVAIAPGESLEFTLTLLPSAHGAPVVCDQAHVSIGTTATRPPPAPPSSIALELQLPLVPALTRFTRVETTVALRNDGKTPVLLNLGMLLGNQKSYPELITLELVDEHGTATSLKVDGPAGVAGRVDAMAVPLPPGATWTFSGKWHSFTPLPPGVYHVTARYQAGNPGFVNSGMPVVRYWSGTLVSNQVDVTLSP